MIWSLIKRLLIFPKGLLGGLIASILMWMVVVFYYNWHATRSVRKLGYEGPVATAGGWRPIVKFGRARGKLKPEESDWWRDCPNLIAAKICCQGHRGRSHV
jgi:hypothetical protein